MAVVNDYNVDYPLDFYNFFKRNRLSLYPVRPYRGTVGTTHGRDNADFAGTTGRPYKIGPFSVDSEKWGDFLCAIFDEWLKRRCGKLLYPVIRCHTGKLGRRTAGRMYPGPDMRTCRRDGIQWRPLCVRPLCIPRIQTGQHLHADINRNDVPARTS